MKKKHYVSRCSGRCVSVITGYFGDADPCFGDIDPPRRKWFKEQIA
jgi:hypothetical protein